MFASFSEQDSPVEPPTSSSNGIIARIAVSLLLPTVALPLVAMLAFRFHFPVILALLIPGMVIARMVTPLLPPAHSNGAWFADLGQFLLVAAAADWLFYVVLIFFLYPSVKGRRETQDNEEVD